MAIDLDLTTLSLELNFGLPGPSGPAGSQGPVGLGLPTGGTMGQLMTKLSSTDYDAGWQTLTGAGLGDVSSDVSVSVDSEVALYSGSTGKVIKRATNTGLLKAASGVIATASVDSDYLSPSSHIDCGTFA